MALADFIQSLQDQDIVYSDPPASSIRVIPPDNKGIKIIPPESIIKTPPKLKLNLRLQELDENSQAPVSVSTTAVTQPVVEIQQPIVQQIVRPQPSVIPPQPMVQQPIVQPIQPQVETKPSKPTEPTAEELFTASGTEISKKALWMEYYEKAKNSKQHNIVSDNMRKGNFVINYDNTFTILPTLYDVRGKDPDDILKDKWF